MLVINGKECPVPGVVSKSFKSHPDLAFTRHFRKRAGTPTIICIHTRMGLANQPVAPPTNTRWDERVPAIRNKSDSSVSWHISIDADGSFVCHLDLVTAHAYHAGHLNARSIGIEIYQDANGGISDEALDTCVLVCDVITRELGIQRQYPLEDAISKRFANNQKGTTRSQQLAYMPGGMAGAKYSGLVGHRNITRNRGKGDPGDRIWEKFRLAGYIPLYLDKNEDFEMWKKIQADLLKMPPKQVDGIPGPNTRKALASVGYAHGLFVRRPGD